jgi:PleD family two-component response regulator
LAERIRMAVSNTPFRYKDLELHVTLSQGVTTWTEPYPFPLDRLIQTADGALYLVKHAGRNGVEYAHFDLGEDESGDMLVHQNPMLRST